MLVFSKSHVYTSQDDETWCFVSAPEIGAPRGYNDTPIPGHRQRRARLSLEIAASAVHAFYEPCPSLALVHAGEHGQRVMDWIVVSTSTGQCGRFRKTDMVSKVDGADCGSSAVLREGIYCNC